MLPKVERVGRNVLLLSSSLTPKSHQCPQSATPSWKPVDKRVWGILLCGVNSGKVGTELTANRWMTGTRGWENGWQGVSCKCLLCIRLTEAFKNIFRVVNSMHVTKQDLGKWWWWWATMTMMIMMEWSDSQRTARTHYVPFTSVKRTPPSSPNPQRNLLYLVHRMTLDVFLYLLANNRYVYQKLWSDAKTRIENWKCPLDWEAFLRESCRLSKVGWVHEPVYSSQICCSCKIKPWLVLNSILRSRYLRWSWLYVLLQGWAGNPDMATVITSGLSRWPSWDQWCSNPRFLTMLLIKNLSFWWI